MYSIALWIPKNNQLPACGQTKSNGWDIDGPQLVSSWYSKDPSEAIGTYHCTACTHPGAYSIHVEAGSLNWKESPKRWNWNISSGSWIFITNSELYVYIYIYIQISSRCWIHITKSHIYIYNHIYIYYGLCIVTVYHHSNLSIHWIIPTSPRHLAKRQGGQGIWSVSPCREKIPCSTCSGGKCIYIKLWIFSPTYGWNIIWSVCIYIYIHTLLLAISYKWRFIAGKSSTMGKSSITNGYIIIYIYTISLSLYIYKYMVPKMEKQVITKLVGIYFSIFLAMNTLSLSIYIYMYIPYIIVYNIFWVSV